MIGHMGFKGGTAASTTMTFIVGASDIFFDAASSCARAASRCKAVEVASSSARSIFTRLA